jgi:hypothetical protein
MPVRVGKCGSKWCVKDPDGSTVPGGEHNTEGDAIDHATAINTNTEKNVMDETITVSGSGSNSNSITDNTTSKVIQVEPRVVMRTPHLDGRIETSSDSVEEIVFPVLESEIEEAIAEKGLEEALAFGPETFDELDQLREHNEEQGAITKVVSDFMALVGNVFSWPSPNKSKKIKELAQEMIERLPEEEEEEKDSPEETEEGEEKDVDYVDTESKNGFFVWKEADGTCRWLGVYSNKFRDDDRPAEILSEQSHVDFIERVEKGELPYPDLYVWHIKSPIGKADLLAYDDTGFSIASGTIEEEFYLALKNTSEDLAMSHGMPSEFIERSKEDPTVITSYVSSEVSVLPRRAAANKRTNFRVLKEEATMSIVPADKRQQIAELLGEDLTAKLELDLDDKAKNAIAVETEVVEEVETEEEPATEATAEETAETEEPAEEEKEAEETEEAVEETAEATVEDVPAANPVEEGEEAADGTDYVDKGELAETLAEILTAITASNAAVVETVKSLSDRVEELETEREEVKEEVSEQGLELVASIPEASLQDLLRKQLANPAKSVIGTKEAAVHGNAALATAQPQETEYDEENPKPDDGLFFHRW